MTLPRALQPFFRLPQVLRDAGFAISPDQTIDFVQGVGLLGPRDITDIWRAGRALFSIPQNRLAEYDAIFRAVFLDQIMFASVGDDEDNDVDAYEPTGDVGSIDAQDDNSEVGAEATVVERLGQRSLTDRDDTAMDRIKREAARALPRRVSYRRRSVRKGNLLDMRRTLREAARRDGDVLRLWETKRKLRQRRVLLLIDVSGSMKERSETMLRLVQAADHAETFTFGHV